MTGYAEVYVEFFPTAEGNRRTVISIDEDGVAPFQAD
jgi:hypothetical protein